MPVCIVCIPARLYALCASFRKFQLQKAEEILGSAANPNSSKSCFQAPPTTCSSYFRFASRFFSCFSLSCDASLGRRPRRAGCCCGAPPDGERPSGSSSGRGSSGRPSSPCRVDRVWRRCSRVDVELALAGLEVDRLGTPHHLQLARLGGRVAENFERWQPPYQVAQVVLLRERLLQGFAHVCAAQHHLNWVLQYVCFLCVCFACAASQELRYSLPARPC